MIPRLPLPKFRKILIAIVLKLDLHLHFREVSMFKTKLASDFPQVNNLEDKLVLMTMTLKLADVGWSCRPLQTMLRWSDRFHLGVGGCGYSASVMFH